MERVAFIIEGTEAQIPCLLNPESLLLQRESGVVTQATGGGVCQGVQLADDPLFFTGGGVTYLTLNLLFDVNLPGIQTRSNDVRHVTGPLWALSENQPRSEGGKAHPAIMRFVWGKAFNFPGVITDIAERLEQFTLEGTPQRSYLRLRMRRVREYSENMSGGAIEPPLLPTDFNEPVPALDEGVVRHAVLGADASNQANNGRGETERIDQLAYEHYGDSSLWRLIAWVNCVDAPERLAAGVVLKMPGREDIAE